MGLKETTQCLGYQQITNLLSSVGLTPPTGATYAVIVAEGQAVRWRDDGVAPTSSVGMPVAVGGVLEYDGDFRILRFIQQSASAVLNVSYYN